MSNNVDERDILKEIQDAAIELDANIGYGLSHLSDGGKLDHGNAVVILGKIKVMGDLIEKLMDSVPRLREVIGSEQANN